MNLSVFNGASSAWAMMLACSAIFLQTQGTRSSHPELNEFQTQLSAPRLIMPTNQAVAVRVNPFFEWNASLGATSYDLQVSMDSTFSGQILGSSGLQDTTYALRGLSHATKYYWRVRARSLDGTTAFSNVYSFRSRLTSGVDGQGKIRASLASEILQHVVGLTAMSGDEFEVAEVSGDWTLSSYDAALVLQAAAGLLSIFPVDQ